MLQHEEIRNMYGLAQREYGNTSQTTRGDSRGIILYTRHLCDLIANPTANVCWAVLANFEPFAARITNADPLPDLFSRCWCFGSLHC
jgi:hypothetical protein